MCWNLISLGFNVELLRNQDIWKLSSWRSNAIHLFHSHGTFVLNPYPNFIQKVSGKYSTAQNNSYTLAHVYGCVSYQFVIGRVISDDSFFNKFMQDLVKTSQIHINMSRWCGARIISKIFFLDANPWIPVVAIRYSLFLFTNEDQICTNLHVQEKNTDMTSQSSYHEFAWRHRSSVVTSRC